MNLICVLCCCWNRISVLVCGVRYYRCVSRKVFFRVMVVFCFRFGVMVCVVLLISIICLWY